MNHPIAHLLAPAAMAAVAGLAIASSMHTDAATSLVTPSVWVGNAVKLTALVSATRDALRCAKAFDRGEPSRNAWIAFACGLGAFVVAQAILASYQLRGDPTPFPSVADGFFVSGSLLMCLAMLRFTAVSIGSGLALGGRREAVGAAVSVALCGIPVAIFVMLPVLQSDNDPSASGLSAVYVVIDLLMLISAGALARITSRLRGGSVGRAWFLVVGGLIAAAIGDGAFAWFSVQDMALLDPLLDVSYAWAYVLMAWGTHLHRKLIEG